MLKNALSQCPLILRLGSEDFEVTALIARCAIEAQLSILEVSMLMPEATIALKKLKSEAKQIVWGAGDILDLKMATQAYEAQVDFYSSPLSRVDLWEYFKGHRVPYVAGALTPTEISFLRQKSFDVVYLEPISLGTIGQLISYSKLFPDIGFIPRTVPSIEEGLNCLKSGALGVAMELSNQQLEFIKARDWIKLREDFKQWRQGLS